MLPAILTEPNILFIIDDYLPENSKICLFRSCRDIALVYKGVNYKLTHFIADIHDDNYISLFTVNLLFNDINKAMRAAHSIKHADICDVLISKGAIRYLKCWSCCADQFYS